MPTISPDMLQAVAIASPVWLHCLMFSHYSMKLRGVPFTADRNPNTYDDFIFEALRGTGALARYVAVWQLSALSFLGLACFGAWKLWVPGGLRENGLPAAMVAAMAALVLVLSSRRRAYKRRRFGM